MVNDPEIVKFCNEGLRPAMDQLVRSYNAAKTLVEVYDATGMSAKLPEDETFSDLIEDGSATDGRPRISAGGVRLSVENIRSLLTQLEGTETPSGLSLIQAAISISPRYSQGG